MKILQLYSSPSPGGGTYHVADLSLGLVERGHKVTVACRPGTQFEQIMDKQPVQCLPLPMRNGIDLHSLRVLVQWIRREQIDLVHAHTGRDGPLAWHAVRLARRGRFFVTRHVHRVPKSRYSRWVLGKADRIITVSQQMRNELMQLIQIPVERVVTIPNWVDLERFSVRTASLEDEVRFTVIGNIARDKGQQVFAEAALPLCECGWQFDMVGLNDHAETGALAHLKRLMRDQSSLQLLPWRNDLPTYLRSVDVVVVPSLREGFSLVAVEAMASGLPVISTSGTGPGEIVRPGETGLLVTPGDVDGLREAMQRLGEDPDLRTAMGQAARRLAEAKYGRKQVIDRIEGLMAETTDTI